ncbi:glutamate synthase large subunit [[Clostridium] colinum]|uniref:glutamate synthase large subunit n=1 Tax=[Clostridium] colinum TaxID=36835 RepID=UPI002024B1F5|nr:glutamate synthase large subunit [[Clostridium] colinum]
MTHYNLPKKQGLYDPKFEHDNCGIGFIANIKGKKNHNIITDAIKILKNLTHRGGVGSEEDTGDGAGILTQIPHKFMKKVCKNEGIDLPEEKEYGVGMFFCSHIKSIRDNTIHKLKEIIEEENQHILGFRIVPTYTESIGKSAKDSMPYIMQVFIKKADNIKTEEDFERKLFVISKRAEKEIRYTKENDPYFYFTSLSCRTIVYKGMLTPEQVDKFYIDLIDLDFESALALVHSRFSTNTFPSWERAHPNRYIIHNGEINTIRGNVNWIKAREKMFETEAFNNEDLEKVLPVINEDGSDSAMLDNYIQMLNLCGYSLPKAIMMAIPEPWENNKDMDKDKRAFYEYNSLMGEAWDGPAAIGFTDGNIIGATLDRNGLRPARYYVTNDDYVILSSEVGVLPIKEENIVKKHRLTPGKMLLIDTNQGKIIEDSEIKENIAKENPYEQWLKDNLISLDSIESEYVEEKEELPLLTRQKAFGYVKEDIELTIKEIVEKGEDPIGAMGNDAPLAVFSERTQLLYNYFKQLFAQVTNPPIDAIREQIVTSTISYLGGEGNLLKPNSKNCKRIKLDTPILSNEDFSKIKDINNQNKDFKVANISIVYNKNNKTMEEAINDIFDQVDKEVENGANILILSDKGVDKDNMPIPLLLISSGVHHHLIKTGNRTKTSIVLQSAESREVHHFALLVGYGANAINPYLTLETIENNFEDSKNSIKIYVKAVTKGIIKVMSKMGISTLQSYQGAQIFEALGICEKVVDKFFTNTSTRIGGIDLEHIEKEAQIRHNEAFLNDEDLSYGGEYKWRKGGEYHMFNPQTVTLLQKAVREGDYSLYKEYAKLMDSHNEGLCTIRSMLDIRFNEKPINIDEVESVESIVKRFKTGAMSYGSLSKEAHECLAIAMNRLGAKSNSGEGGEIPERFVPMENGDSKCSAIKQVASGRFGVSINYLQNAVEIQIKLAQGAKPGEGGHLPGKKVYPWIAKARNSTTGVDLISPPPHHDIYSIEDLAQLIHDLKNANRNARISVKLVSEAGVGTIAVGVAKSLADVILISGYDGGTGAAPRTSIRHAGLPWELGLSETHQALLLNNLRNRVVLEADGKMLTGRDVLVACLLGAEEFGFSTAPLIAIGCAMLRVCHMDTCAVGVATQNPELRKRFKGKPEHVENFMEFVAMDLREQMARLGFRTIEEMVGRVEKLVPKKVDNYKAKTVDLSSILYQPKGTISYEQGFFNSPQNHNIEKSFDYNTLLKLCEPAIYEDKKIEARFNITNINRVCGTILSSEIAKVKGEDGLKDDTINLTFEGSAGQSFGAFLSKGITMKVLGDCNDYVGKGLSGGKIIVKPSDKSNLVAEENVIIGNVALFGAIKGEAYINGIAGERFCVRNSGAIAVVEGIGEHGLEYMTGGKVLILGKTGRNFGAGMSGGIAYVYNEDGEFPNKCNLQLISLEELNNEDKEDLKQMLQNHYKYTNSPKAKKMLDNIEVEINKFTKVIPKAYKKVIEQIKIAKEEGLSEDDAMMKAFENAIK